MNPDQGQLAGVAVVLASASPRRSELLGQLSDQFEVCAADIDESLRAGEAPARYVARMAREKAEAVKRRLLNDCPVLGADTAVVVDDRILGKPVDRNDAKQMLRSLSGRSHEVFSAVALLVSETEIFERLNITRVTFAPFDEGWIDTCCDSDEPMDKAGAYAIQGLAARWISRIEGSYSGVMGLPLFETAQLFDAAGLGAYLTINGN